MFDRYEGSVDHPDGKELLWLGALGVAIGIISGLCSIAFRLLIAFFHNLAFRGDVSFSYDSKVHAEAAPWGVGIILVPMIGALAVAFLVKNFAPRARTHGVPEVMESIYYHDGKIRAVLVLVKALSSSISIGTGGSIGREGPIVQIAAGFGSGLGGWLNLPGRVRTVLLAAAAAGGIAGSFNAPIGGVLFAAELLLPAISAAALLSVTLSAVTATLLARLVFSEVHDLPVGALPLFDAAYLMEAVPALLVLGVVTGAVSTGFVLILCHAEHWFGKLSQNYYIRHSFGMLLVGLEIYAFYRLTGLYYVEGLGYSTIFELLNGGITSLALLGLLLLGKAVATSVTLGSGGSGGVFCPSLFLGALTGALVGELLAAFIPGIGAIPRLILVMAGMAAVVGGTTGAVFSGIVMVSELTGNYQVLTATALTSVVALALRRTLIGGGIYTQKLIRRGRSIPEGMQSAVWTSRRAGDLMVKLPGPPETLKNFIRVDADMDMDAVLREWYETGADGVIVLRDGEAAGVVRDSELGHACRTMAERML